MMPINRISASQFPFTKETPVLELLKRVIREGDRQDFAEYALILGAVALVAIAVIARYHSERHAAFEASTQALIL